MRFKNLLNIKVNSLLNIYIKLFLERLDSNCAKDKILRNEMPISGLVCQNHGEFQEPIA